MEFPFDVQSLLPGEITRLVGEKLPHTLSSLRKTLSHDDQLAIIVDEMGVASAKAQGLRLPITTYEKLVTSNHILYIMSDNGGQRGSVVGILKLGLKRLFLTDRLGVVHEVEPLCVLDFYVHESRQRSGCGKRLFEELLKAENLKPYEVAIDRPSPKFIGFLKKHYQLASFVSQANNYVVFDQFFSTCKDLGRQSRRYSLPSVAKRWTVDRPDPVSLPIAAHIPAQTTPSNTSAEFIWSPENASKSFNSSFSPQTREREFNIITGQDIKGSDSFNNVHRQGNNSSWTKRQTDSFIGEEEVDMLRKIKVTQHSEPWLSENKAPHLNMRRGSNPRRLWDSEHYKASSSTSHVTSGAGGHMRYSRHAGVGGGSLPQPGNDIKISGTSARLKARTHRHYL